MTESKWLRLRLAEFKADVMRCQDETLVNWLSTHYADEAMWNIVADELQQRRKIRRLPKV